MAGTFAITTGHYFLPGDKTEELPYMVMLNNNLPNDIRVLAWSPVDTDFNARFSCLHRTYKYFFPKGNMDINVSLSCVYTICIYNFLFVMISKNHF